jgi:hypothetical protein
MAISRSLLFRTSTKQQTKRSERKVGFSVLAVTRFIHVIHFYVSQRMQLEQHKSWGSCQGRKRVLCD